MYSKRAIRIAFYFKKILTLKKKVMKFDKATVIHYGVSMVVIVASVLIATNVFQPMINARKVSVPQTA